MRLTNVPDLAPSVNGAHATPILAPLHAAPAVLPAAVTTAPARRFRVLSAREVMVREPVPWRVHGLLPAEGVAVLFGPSAAGKSLLVVDLMFAIASGVEWFGRSTTQCPVTYLVQEDAANLPERLRAAGLKFGEVPAGLNVVDAPVSLFCEADVADLARDIASAGGRGGVVVVDTLSAATAGADENSSRDMGLVLRGIAKLRANLGGLVLLVHHAGKDTSKGMRGHSSLFGAADAVVEITVSGQRRVWRTTKLRNGPDGERHSFRLASICGQTVDGQSLIASCVIAPDDIGGADVKPAMPRRPNQAIAIAVLDDLLKSDDRGPPDLPAEVPQGVLAVAVERAVAEIASKLDVTPRKKRERAREAIASLLRDGTLRSAAGFIWLA